MQSRRVRRYPRRKRHLKLILLLCALAAAAGLVVLAEQPQVAPWRLKIAASASSQLGYRTDPPSTFCNKFSAYWESGQANCGNHNRDEEWCADFAAWAWRQAKVPFQYGQQAGQINSAGISFYLFGVGHRTWHPIGSGYQPRPGDVAVYGLDLAAHSVAHVAVVVSYQTGERGPNVVNGDGDRTGFSVVEGGTDQYRADTPGGDGGALAGYVSPLPPRAPARSAS